MNAVPTQSEPVETGHTADLSTPVPTTAAQAKRAQFVVHKGLTHIARDLSQMERKVAMALGSLAAITDYPHIQDLFPSNPATKLTGKYFQRKRKALFKWMRSARPAAYAALMKHYQRPSPGPSASTPEQLTKPSTGSNESKPAPSQA